MAKVGRPTTYDKFIKWAEDVGDIGFSRALMVSKMINNSQSSDKSTRWKQNDCYAMMARLIWEESEAASEIPYFNEMQKHDGIMEQLGRLIFQDEYDGDALINVTLRAAEAYHNGYKAKEVAAWIRGVRQTGIIEE